MGRTVFPPDAIVLSAEHYGQSAWTQTGCVTLELGDGTLKKYFLKVRRNPLLDRSLFSWKDALMVPIALGVEGENKC